MGLLAPLYALAALAVAAPILFHLIRRQPRGRLEFSSLMFLQPSPPRLTRRSRLDNLWLLLLRATALVLIALAFARPFLRSAELADAQAAGREVLLLVDTSGSMQREDVWKNALAAARKTVDGLGEHDRVGLASFDSSLNLIVPLPNDEEKLNSTAQADQAAVRSALGDLKPGYRATSLSDALMEAAELMQSRTTSRTATAEDECEIVLFSDLHESSNLDALQGYSWPENVRLDIRRVDSQKRGNARATLMQASASGGDQLATQDSPAGTKQDEPSDPNLLRVRVENNANSAESAFELSWSDDPGAKSHTVNVQVPPGQARVIPLPASLGGANHIVLSGDAATHDNILYVPHTQPRQERLGFVGSQRAKSEDDLYFFLAQVPLSTPVRSVTTERIEPRDLSVALADESLSALVLEWPFQEQLAPNAAKMLEDFCRRGHPILVVLARPGPETKSAASGEPAEKDAPDSELLQRESEGLLVQLLGLDGGLSIREAESRDFALLSDINFQHRLFQPLADAKFNDFGKVRFWSHRALELPADSVREGDLQVLARFDDQTPAIVHRRLGRGDMWILTAGWQTTGSQFALSSKFVPLLFGMLDPRGQSLELNSVYEVGEVIPKTDGATVTATHLDGRPVRTLAQGGGLAFEEPGVYWLSEDGQRRQIAIALPISESQLDPLDLDRFGQLGVVTGKSETAQERTESARLSQIAELESRQKLWRWLLVAALGLLVIETLVAARGSHLPPVDSSPSSPAAPTLASGGAGNA